MLRMTKQLRTIFISSISEVDREQWDKIIDTDYPFIQYDFFMALESSRVTSAKTGWLPFHLLLFEGSKLVGLMPLFIKSHSYGEYVFDFQWANAYHQSGIEYYPKLVTAIPYTPSTGTRIFLDQSVTYQRAITEISNALSKVATDQQISSWHCLFPTEQESDQLSQTFLQRAGIQYHWLNRGYRSFDEFLLCCKAKQRKNIKRERRLVKEQGIIIQMLDGQQIDQSIWQVFYQFYQSTYLKRSGHGGYFNYDFFREMGDKFADSLVMGIARIEDQIIAASLFFKDKHQLYGRYWGSSSTFDCLHFELCYYQGIEYCINNNLTRFDAGAQGEHKIQRGFTPHKTYSNHWIKNNDFSLAISRFLVEENTYTEQTIKMLTKKLPFKSV